MPYNLIVLLKDTTNDYIFAEKKSRENYAGAYRVFKRQSNLPRLVEVNVEEKFYLVFNKEYKELPEYIINHIKEEDYIKYLDEFKSICLTADNKKKELHKLLLKCPYYGYKEWFLYKLQLMFGLVYETCILKAPCYISFTVGFIAFLVAFHLISLGYCLLPLYDVIGYFLDHPKGCEKEIQWFSELYLKYPHLDQSEIDHALKEQLDELVTTIQSNNKTIFGTIVTDIYDDEVASWDSYGSDNAVSTHHAHYARHYDRFVLNITSTTDPNRDSKQTTLAVSIDIV